MDKYYRSDDRDAVRTKCLAIMTETVLANRHMYEADLLEKGPSIKDVRNFFGILDPLPSLVRVLV